ncbi:hypothetical protein EMVG_00269, partial [Emiliania huxleyi virus PS401]
VAILAVLRSVRSRVVGAEGAQMIAFPTRLRRVICGFLTAISAWIRKRLGSPRRIPALGADGLVAPLLEGVVRSADLGASHVNAVSALRVELFSFAAPFSAAELVRCGVEGAVDPVFGCSRQLHSGEEGEEEAAKDGESLIRASAAPVDVRAVLAVCVRAIGVEVVQRSLHVLGWRRDRL